MVTPADFASFPAVILVDQTVGHSVIYSPGGEADAHLRPVFEAAGLEGGGYDWQGMVHALVLERAETLLGRFGFDSEAGMFCVYGEDLAALHAVAGIVQELIGDVDLARRALHAAEEKDLLD